MLILFYTIYSHINYYYHITTTIQSEDEASAQLTEGYCLQTDIYAPIRESIRNLLSGNNAPAVVVAGPLAGNVPVGVEVGQTAGSEGGVSSTTDGSSATEAQQGTMSVVIY